MKWFILRNCFIIGQLIKGNTIAAARVEWTYKLLDLVTLRDFPETPSYQLPSNSRNKNNKPAALP